MSGSGSCRDDLDTWMDDLPDEQPRPEQAGGDDDNEQIYHFFRTCPDLQQTTEHDHDAPAAPERGDQPRAWMRRWAYESKPCPPKVKNAKGRWEWPKESQFKEVTNVKIFADDVPLFTVEQHSTLMAQRERLIQILQAACSTLKSYQYGNVSPELAKEMIRTIEQVLTTSEQEGRR